MAKVRGTGIAAINYPTGMALKGDPTQCLIFAQPNGKFAVFLASTDAGQGLKTVMAQIAAETLGVPPEDIIVRIGDTDHAPHDSGTFASRSTHRAGNAVMQAAQEAKKSLLEIAAKELEVSPDDLDISDGAIRVKGVPETRMTVQEAVAAANFKHGIIVAGRGMYLDSKSWVEPETGACDPDTTMAHGCSVVEVEVDTETGQVDVLKITSVFEIGRQINPKLVEGQIIGGAVMGMSQALTETVNPYYPSLEHQAMSYRDYAVPKAVNVPQIKSQVLEYPTPSGPYGAKGIGEMTNNTTAPAIVNAIYDAVGVWITDLPITPEKVMRALREKTAGKS